MRCVRELLAFQLVPLLPFPSTSSSLIRNICGFSPVWGFCLLCVKEINKKRRCDSLAGRTRKNEWESVRWQIHKKHVEDLREVNRHILIFVLINGTRERLLKKPSRSLKHEMERKKMDNQLFASISWAEPIWTETCSHKSTNQCGKVDKNKTKNIKCRNTQTSVRTQLPQWDSFPDLTLQVGDCKALLTVQREILKNTNMGGRGWGGKCQQIIHPYYPGPRVKIKITKPLSWTSKQFLVSHS